MTDIQLLTRSSTCRLLWLAISLGAAICARAGTFSSSTTAPPVNGADIANLATSTGTDKWFFQTANEADPSDAAKGQTFITDSTTVKLKALTYKIGSGSKGATTTYKLRVGTVSGTTFTQIFTETITQTVSTASGAYMTWTLGTPLTLSPNTTYAIDVAMDSAVSWTTGLPYLSITGNISNARIGQLYDSGDLGVGNSTMTFTAAEDRVFHLDLEDPQNPSPDDGATVPAGNVVLSWTNLPPTTGTNVWVDVWFGTNASALTKVVSASQNLTTHTVSAPIAATYYWRIDTYRNGVATGTPTTGTRFDFVVADTDADGMPDAFELLHTTPASGTALNPGDDLDSDGLTNIQEYQRGTLPRDNDTDNDTLLDGPELTGVGSRPPTSPTDSDSDNDGLNDGVESNTGIWVSTSNRGTNPTRSDTDGDGISDGAETNSGTYTSETNTGTSPLSKDSDGDNAEDWYEVTAAYTNPTLATSKPNIPYPLPDPDASTGTGTKPVKVFILSGQSNMVGFGRVAGSGNDTLQSVTQIEKKFPNLITSTNAWTVRNDVLYRGVISALGDAPLEPGFGESEDSFGPELGFGHAVGYIHDEPVLIIKTSIGNRSLGWDFLPPGSARYTYSGATYAGYGDYVKQPGSTTVPDNWYAGKQYDDSFLHENDMGAKAWASGLAYVIGSQVKHGGITYSSKTNHTSTTTNAPVPAGNTNWAVYSVFNVCDILDNFAAEYPQWATRGFEIGGFGWFQGWNDGQSTDTEYSVRYEQNLVRLIKQLRLYYTGRYPGKIQPTAPFVTVTCGFDGFAAAGNRLTVVNAQLAVGNGTSYPEFAGNVKSMEGRGYWRTTGPNTAQNYHYYHNAETYMLVGDAMGRGMAELLANGSTASQLTSLTISSGTLAPVFAGETFAYTTTVAASSITVTPTLVGATITVNGATVASGAASTAIPLNIGANTITVASTLSGSTSTYTLTVTRTQNTYTWATDLAGPSSWNAAANWTPNTGFPNGTDDLANLTNEITADNQLSLAAPITIGGLNIGDATGDSAFVVNAGQPITFNVGTGSATLTRTAVGASADIISAPIILADPLSASGTATTGSLALNGVISETGGAKTLTKNGAGILTLGAANTYTGGTILTAGSLHLGHVNALSSGTLTIGNNTNNPYLNNTSGSAITATNNMVWAGNFRMGGTYTINSNVTLTASLTVEHYSTVTINGVISGAFQLTKNGNSGIVLSGLNTYTGNTIVRQGSATINTIKNYGVPSSLGAPATGSIVIAPNNSTTLAYTGTGDTTNRTIQVGGSGSAVTTTSIANNGTGALTFTAAVFNTPVGVSGGSAARSLTLGGSFGTTTTPNEVQGIIGDNTLSGTATTPANLVNFAKGGAGVWKISGVNTYSGTTTLSSGTLIMGASNVFPDTTVFALGAATLDVGTRTDTAGTLDVTTPTATIRLGTGAALAFADSSAVDWTGGTLTITGTFVSGASLRFGTTSSGLTATQLTQIVSAGFNTFALNGSGYLIASTAPTYTTWQSANPGSGTFTTDHDNDGVANGIEFFLGGNTNTTGQTPLPGVTNTSGTLSITWTKSATYPGTYGTNFWVETTDTLIGTWVTETVGGAVTVNGNNVTYTFPASLRRFVRLRVVGP